MYDDEYNFEDGLCLLKKGRDLVIITTGLMVHKAFEIADELEKQSIHVGILDLYRVKPANEELLLSILEMYREIVTMEEHSIIGGIESLLCDFLIRYGKNIPISRFAIADRSCDKYGDRAWMHAYYGIDVQSVCKAIIHSKQAEKRA